MSAARTLSIAAIALGLIAAGPVHAQATKERAPVVKVLLENDKVRVTETTFLPGDVSRQDRKARTNYILTDGKLERTAKDGKKTAYERKAGTAVWLGPDSDVVKNVGKSTYVVIGVTQK
jgi:hypothetical protein